MRYRREWKRRGLLVEATTGVVSDHHGVLGQVWSQHQEGARTPNGMVTNTVWKAASSHDGVFKKFSTLTAALDYLLNHTGIGEEPPPV